MLTEVEIIFDLFNEIYKFKNPKRNIFEGLLGQDPGMLLQ